MSEQPLIAAFAPGPWGWPDFAGSPRYHLWELARRGWRVVYFEPPRKLLAPYHEWVAEDRPFRAVMLPRLAPFGLRGSTNRIILRAARRLASELWWRAAAHYLNERKMTASVYWFGAPWHGILAGKVPKHAVCVQHVYDELAISPIYNETQKSCMAHWEAELLRRCEACFCSSVPQVKARQRPDAKCAIELLQNAVSEEYFNAPASRCPIALIERMKSIPRPRIVYGGVADLRLDGALLSQCVEKLPHAQFVFLGKQDASLDTQFARFAHDHPRVHFFGSLPYLAFPTLYAEADTLMIAHKRMAFTDAMYPEKLNEYLASGKPVVSVALPEVQRIAAEAADPRAVRVAADAREYVALIEESLGEKNEQLAQARINLAHKHTWSIEADTLNQRLREMLSR